MNLERNGGGINVHFEARWNCSSYTLHYGALSRPFVVSVWTAVRKGLVNDVIIAFSKIAVWAPFPLFDDLGNVSLDDQMLFMVFRRRFDWRLLDFCWLFAFTAICFPWHAAVCSFFKDVAWYANLCNGGFLWILQSACVLCLKDCLGHSTKILLRTYPSYTCGHLIRLSPSSFPNASDHMVWQSKNSCNLVLQWCFPWHSSLWDDSPLTIPCQYSLVKALVWRLPF